jgi:ABC-type nitrate/sulfonate/bicarbonate transport system substrate-binding protein
MPPFPRLSFLALSQKNSEDASPAKADRRDFVIDMEPGGDRCRSSQHNGGFMRKKLLMGYAIWLGLFLAFEQAGAASAPDKIKFPYSPMSWNSLPWWVAKDAGHFDKNGLDVDLFYEGASSAIVQAMLAGEANFAGLAGPSVVTNVLAGGDVIQIAAVVKTFTIPMYSQPNITAVAQLKGQKVAVSRFGSISHIAAQNIFQKAGVTGATVVQSGGTPESAAMLMSGNVVAAMVPPPQSLMLKEKGFRELVSVRQFREWNIPVVENGIAARRSFIDKNPSVAKRFIRAAFEGIQTIYTNKELAIKTLAKYTKVSDEKILEESYRFSVEALTKEGMMPQEAFAALLEQLVSQKSIDEAASKKLPLTAYFDNRFVIELEREGFFKKLWQ